MNLQGQFLEPLARPSASGLLVKIASHRAVAHMFAVNLTEISSIRVCLYPLSTLACSRTLSCSAVRSAPGVIYLFYLFCRSFFSYSKLDPLSFFFFFTAIKVTTLYPRLAFFSHVPPTPEDKYPTFRGFTLIEKISETRVHRRKFDRSDKSEKCTKYISVSPERK